jgi:TolB-like protein
LTGERVTVAVQVAVRDRAKFLLHLKSKAADIKQVGRELGLRYVLEGSSIERGISISSKERGPRARYFH